MSKDDEQPKVAPGDRDNETIESHPAYAQISVSRVSGQRYLYGSDFHHQHYLTLSIYRSELRRDLSCDWPYPREEYIEVAMSEAQWATLLSTMNTHGGVQCTLNHKDMKRVSGIPNVKSRQQQFQAEANLRMDRAMQEINAMRSKIVNGKLSGTGKKELLDHLESAVRDLTSNLKFVADQFGEHMEQVTQRAKTEIDAYVSSAINRAGVAAIAEGKAPFALPNKTSEDEGITPAFGCYNSVMSDL